LAESGYTVATAVGQNQRGRPAAAPLSERKAIMSQAQIDQVAAVKASLELMVAENAEIHEYFKDLLVKVAELEEETPEKRRSKFKDLVSMGAFRFNGLDIRHFTQSHHQPLPPPLFYGRTKRRLGNTLKLVEEFARRVGDQVEIREVDLLTERETARAFGIFSVPSTVVLDADGRVVAFNIGFAPAERLLVQLPHTRNGGAATRS